MCTWWIRHVCLHLNKQCGHMSPSWQVLRDLRDLKEKSYRHPVHPKRGQLFRCITLAWDSEPKKKGPVRGSSRPGGRPQRALLPLGTVQVALRKAMVFPTNQPIPSVRVTAAPWPSGAAPADAPSLHLSNLGAGVWVRFRGCLIGDGQKQMWPLAVLTAPCAASRKSSQLVVVLLSNVRLCSLPWCPAGVAAPACPSFMQAPPILHGSLVGAASDFPQIF